MADAAVHIGPLGDDHRIMVERFYQGCGLEFVGPGRITTGIRRRFDTLEDLLDHILARAELYHVIVCHGYPDRGLIMRFGAESPKGISATGMLIGGLGGAARKVQLGEAENTAEIVNLASYMGVSPTTARRIVGKIARLPARHLERVGRAKPCGGASGETPLRNTL